MGWDEMEVRPPDGFIIDTVSPPDGFIIDPPAVDENRLGQGDFVRTSRALMETAMAAFSGLYSWPAGKVAGVVTHLLTGDIDAAKAVDEGVQNELMVKPKTAEGEYITNSLFRLIGSPFEIASEFARTAAQMVKGSPAGPIIPERAVLDYYADIGGVLMTGGAVKGLMKIARDGIPKGGEAVPEFLKEITGRGPVEEAARVKAETETENYRISHRPMTVAGGAARLYDLTVSFGDDIYGRNALQYFGTGNDVLDKSTLRILQSLRGKPEADITIYRAVPENAHEINAGDWVTINKKVAESYVDAAKDQTGENFKIIEKKVKAKDLTTNADSFHEQGYYPEKPTQAGRASIFNERGAIPLREKEAPLLHEFPEPINSRYKAAIPENPTLWQKGTALLETLKNKLSREYEHLPKTEEFANLRFELLNLSKYKGIASDRATRALEEIVAGLDRPTMDLFEKRVILDDLLYSAERDMALPYGFTRESLAAEKIIIDDLVNKNPEVAESIAKRKATWEQIKAEYLEAMESIGLNVEERFTNPDYYHHQVLEYAQAQNIFGAGKKLKTPANRGFLKKRQGSELDINRDYLQVEHDVMSQMIHDVKVAQVIKTVDEQYNIAKDIRANAKAQGLEDWKDAIPEGYDLWQPREGQVFYMTQAVPAQIANELLSGALAEYGIKAEDLKGAMAVGGPRREFVLKNEIIETLNNLTKPDHDNVISKGSAYLMRQWKEKVALLNPKGLFKYNARNISGDAEGVFVGNPSAFSKSGTAFRELWNAFYGDGKMSKNLSDFFQMGGFESTLQSLEINKFGDLKAFSHVREKNGNLLTAPADVWGWYWKNAQIGTSVREATLRYAAYLDYLEQMKTSTDGLTPRNFGASIPEEISGLPTAEKRAYWLQNDLLGAYDRVGVIGSELREHIWPFWSWKEANFKRYINLWNNAADSAELATKIGKTIGAKAPYVAYKIGALAVKVTGLMAMLEVYNNTFFKEEEDNLPESVKRSAHIIFGKDSEGKTIYFDRMGMLSDFLSNFGLDGAHRLVPQVLSGKITMTEAAKEMAKGPLNVVVGGVSPYFKWPAELLTSRKSFPDVTKMGTIRDKKLYIAEQLRLGDEYKALFGLPFEGYEKTIKNLFVYTSDPGRAAYVDIMEEKRRFAERMGKEEEGYFITAKGNAMFNYKLALRYKDFAAAEHYLDEYIAKGGTGQGFVRSMQALNPLYAMNPMDRMQFMASLNDEGMKKLERAMDYYIDILAQGEAPKTGVTGQKSQPSGHSPVPKESVVPLRSGGAVTFGKGNSGESPGRQRPVF
jgi:hypothetical protein